MYYCDCVEAHEDKGVTVPKTRGNYYYAGIHFAQAVETKNGNCIHCGYAAFFSKDPIKSLGITPSHGHRDKVVKQEQEETYKVHL